MAIPISFNAIKKSVEKAINEGKTKVIDEFEVFVKGEVDDESFEPIRELFEGFRERLKEMNVKLEEEIVASVTSKKNSKGAGEKTKKAASAYNIFIRDKILELKKSNPELKGQELMRLSTAAWRDSRVAQQQA